MNVDLKSKAQKNSPGMIRGYLSLSIQVCAQGLTAAPPPDEVGALDAILACWA